MITLNFVKDRLAAEELSATARRVSEPQIQNLTPPMSAEQRAQVDAIKYFFRTYCGHAAG
jgi:hypothetical protein